MRERSESNSSLIPHNDYDWYVYNVSIRISINPPKSKTIGFNVCSMMAFYIKKLKLIIVHSVISAVLPASRNDTVSFKMSFLKYILKGILIT